MFLVRPPYRWLNVLGESHVADALNMYYEGMSLAEIRRNFIQQDNNYLTRTSPYNWVQRFTELAVKEADKYHPNVGSIWVADETVIDIDGKNVWFWDMIDTKTRFLIASHMSFNRTGLHPYDWTDRVRRIWLGLDCTP